MTGLGGSATNAQLGAVASAILAAIDGDVVLAAPLGLGKPHALINAIYAAVKADPDRRLTILTALSLDPPRGSSLLEKRFLGPFVDRHFDGFVPLDYVADRRAGRLPANVTVEEFYLQSGSLLDNQDAQQSYASLNYTHVARAVAARGVNLVVHLVAADPDDDAHGALSLSCNPDVTFDLIDAVAAGGGKRPLIAAQIHPDLPFFGGAAAAPRAFFDVVVDDKSEVAGTLFALPRTPVGDADWAIGLYASTLVKDGGTLQIGIGALSDAMAHALILRHTRNAEYRLLIEQLWPAAATSPLVAEFGGLGPFEHGLYGASELLMDGFRALIDAGVLRRLVVEDQALMQRLHDETASDTDRAELERDGSYLHAAFWLGSRTLIDWLSDLDAERRQRIQMTRVSHINELYGGNETLERLQRREARFFNTCMLMTALGAATSDQLGDGRVVSGVGGQYNFVAMAHALPGARSVLMFRATHGAGPRAAASLHWSYGQCTIPRHLRDIAISEYGIADLRGATDAQCARAMIALADARHQAPLLAAAKRAKKLPRDEHLPHGYEVSTPDSLAERLADARAAGLLPDYPLGSDFTAVEQQLARALGWLKFQTATPIGRIATISRALLGPAGAAAAIEPAMARMALAAPRGIRERFAARLLRYALSRTTASQ